MKEMSYSSYSAKIDVEKSATKKDITPSEQLVKKVIEEPIDLKQARFLPG